MKHDYKVIITVKNNWFLDKLAEAGFTSVAALSRSCGVSQQRIGAFINLKLTPLNLNGDWRDQVLAISSALKCLPEDLFPPQHLNSSLKKNKSETLISADQVSAICNSSQPDRQLLIDDCERSITSALVSLKPRYEQIVRLIFGIGETEPMSIDEIAKKFSIGRQRVYQIRDESLSELRKKHGNKLRDALNSIAA